MKVEKYYDIGCDICSCHRSTDYEKGMETNRELLLKFAKQEGWCTLSGKTVCPLCAKKAKSKTL